MYCITGGVGFLACIIFMILIIRFAVKGKSCTVPLIAYLLSILLVLGSGFLYSKTDPNIGGGEFLKYVLRDRSVPPDLIGEWREAGDSDSYHGIYINGNTIEIYFVSDGGRSRTLYWAGSFEAPSDGAEPYTWVSRNDASRTSAALLASGDNTKEFTYLNGKLSYSATVLGVTTTIHAEKQSWGYFGIEEPAESEADGEAAE